MKRRCATFARLEQPASRRDADAVLPTLPECVIQEGRPLRGRSAALPLSRLPAHLYEVRVEPVADQMVEVVAVQHLVDRLLDAPALPVEPDRDLWPAAPQGGDGDPRAALVRRRARAEGDLSLIHI